MLGIKPVLTSTNMSICNHQKRQNHSSLIATEKYRKGLGEKLCNFNKATNGIVLGNMKYIS